MRTPSGFPNAPATASDALFRKPSLICAFGTDVAITQVGIVANALLFFLKKPARTITQEGEGNWCRLRR